MVHCPHAGVVGVELERHQAVHTGCHCRLGEAWPSWVVAEVRGTSNMFPVNSPTEFPPLDVGVIINSLASGLDLSSLPLASKLKPQQLHYSTPYAITNPIWIDANNDGAWTPPKQPLHHAAPAPRVAPDVRAQFEAIP